MTSVAVIGDGQMGLVLADALHARGAEVRVWGPFSEHMTDLVQTRTSPRLPNFSLPKQVAVIGEGAALFDGVDVAINAIPTQFIRNVWTSLKENVPAGIPITCVAKGIEMDSLLLPTQILTDVVGESSPTCVLSGPSIATELVEHLPAVMVASSSDAAVANHVQDMFDVPWLRIYTHDDPLGVELSGATKNVIAIATGVVEALGLGRNASAGAIRVISRIIDSVKVDALWEIRIPDRVFRPWNPAIGGPQRGPSLAPSRNGAHVSTPTADGRTWSGA